MQELKRIFFSRKYIGALFLLLILNAWFIWNDQKPEKDLKEYYEENYQGNYIKDENEKYKELIKQYQTRDMDELASELAAYFEAYWEEVFEKREEEIEEDFSLSKKDIEVAAISSVREQVDYIAGYQNYLQGIDESAEKMREVSALGTEGSFSRKNIDKTVKDYAPLKTLTLKLDNERAVNAFTKCTLTGLFLMIQAIVTVLIMLEERKKGLWHFVYSLPQGRSRLAFFRCISMFLAVAFAGILLEGENLIITGGTYGGFGDISRAVQSNPEFSGCVLTVSMGTWLFLVIFTKIIVCTFIGMIFWAAVSSLKNHTAAFAVLAAILAGEYYAYTEIGTQSSLNRLKYMNLFGFLDSGYALSHYQNLNFFGNPVGVYTLLLYTVPLLLLFVCVLAVILGRQKPFSQKESLWARIYEKIIFALKPYRHNSVFLHECYKVFVKQKCILILFVMGLISYFMIDVQEIYYDYGTTIYNSYINQIKGPVTEQKTAYLQSESRLWMEKADASREKTSQYEKLLEQSMEDGNTEYTKLFFSNEDYEQELKKIRQYEQSQEIVDNLLHLSERLEDLQAKGVNTGFVNKIGYEMYFGTAGNHRSAGEAMIMLAFLIVSLAGIKSYEGSQNADKFIKSTKRGRSILYRRKCAVALIVTLFVFLMPTLSGFYNISKTYGITEFQVAAQSLDEFAKFPLTVSLGGLLLIVWIFRFIMLAAVAGFIIFLSGRTKNMMVSVFLCVLLLLAPAGLVYMGFSAVSFLSVLRPLTVTYFWNKYGFEGIMCMLPCIILLMAGIAAQRIGKKDSVKAE